VAFPAPLSHLPRPRRRPRGHGPHPPRTCCNAWGPPRDWSRADAVARARRNNCGGGGALQKRPAGAEDDRRGTRDRPRPEPSDSSPRALRHRGGGLRRVRRRLRLHHQQCRAGQLVARTTSAPAHHRPDARVLIDVSGRRGRGVAARPGMNRDGAPVTLLVVSVAPGARSPALWRGVHRSHGPEARSPIRPAGRAGSARGAHPVLRRGASPRT